MGEGGRLRRSWAVVATVCVVAAVVAVPGSTAIAQSQRFPDVPVDHYAFEAVEWAAGAGVTAGYDDGTFKPQRPLSKRHAVVFMERYYDEILQADQSDDFTRGDMMVLLKAINDGTLRTGPAPGAAGVAQSQRFPDVPVDHYAFEAVEWAAGAGVTAGYDDGTFKPQRPLSKRHAVVFMERYYDEILQADQSDDFTRGDMMVLLKAINDAAETSHAELWAVPGEATVVPYRGRASVSWPPADALPGSPVAGYEVQWRAQGQAWDATRRAVVITQSYEIYGLSDDTHHVRVRRAIVERAEAAGASITSAQGTAPTAELVAPPPGFDEASSISAYDGVVNFEMTGDPVWPATIEIPVDMTKVDDDDFIFLMSFNEEHQLWLPEPGAVFDPEAGVVTAEVYHLTTSTLGLREVAAKATSGVARGLNKGADLVKEVGRDALDTATITAEIVVKPVVNAGQDAVRFVYDKAKDVVYWTEQGITYSMKALKMSADIALETARQYWEAVKLVAAVPYIESMAKAWYERNVEFDSPDCAADSELGWVKRVYIPTADSPMIVCGEAAGSGDLRLKVASQRYYPLVLEARNASGGGISISPDTGNRVRVERTEGGSDLSEVLTAWLHDITDDARHVLPVGATHWLLIPQSALGQHDSMTLEAAFHGLTFSLDKLLLAVDLLLTTRGISASSGDVSLLADLGEEIAACVSSASREGLGNEQQLWQTFSEALHCVQTAVERAGVLKASVSLLGPYAIVLWFSEAVFQLAGAAQALIDINSRKTPSIIKILAEPSSEDPAQESSSTARFSAVSAGGDHSCGLRTDGIIVCWGDNEFGQLDASDGSFSAVSAGYEHSCGLRTDETIVCWGHNSRGQLDAPDPGIFGYTAVSAGHGHSCGIARIIVCWGGQLHVPDGRFTAVSAGDELSCGLRTDETIVCWGWNRRSVGEAPFGARFRAVSAGVLHSCGLRTDDTIVCWGANFGWVTNGGLLDAPSGSFRAVSAGPGHSCGLRADGTVVCWGYNDWGQSDAPGGSFRAVSAGGNHSCGLRADGTVVCWGSNSHGQLDAP